MSAKAEVEDTVSTRPHMPLSSKVCCGLLCQIRIFFDPLTLLSTAPYRIKYPVRTMNDSVQYFATVTAVNRAGLNTSVSGLPIKVDTSA